MKQIKQLFLFLAFVPFFISCSSSQTKPEDAIYQLIGHAEQLIEEHHGRNVKQLIAENYGDDKKRTKKDLEQIITYYLLRHQTIHILQQTTEVNFINENHCSATVFAAMAGRGGAINEMLDTLQTDVYKFVFSIKKADSDWKVTSADWNRASTEDIRDIWGSLVK